MSHFAVMVVGSNVKEQLSFFNENLDVEPYDKECWCKKSNLIKEVDKKLKEHFDYEFDHLRKTYDKDGDIGWEEHTSSWFKKEEELNKELSDEFEKPSPDCKECGGSGMYETTYNPESKWDWYSIGGRWSGMLKLKPETKGNKGQPGVNHLMGQTEYPEDEMYVDQALKKDIDFEGMEEEGKIRRSKNWDKAQKEIEEGKINKDTLDWKYGISKKDTKESYINDISFSTYAVLKDGKWYEKGEMLWFGMASNEKEEDVWDKEFGKLLKSLDGDTLITIVDCHI